MGTIAERRLMGSTQRRRGPNVIGFFRIAATFG